jgi:hypothetical protein
MKLLVGLLSLVLTATSIASSGETKTFKYDGSQNSVELLLKGDKTHTEYRYENRQSICYRSVTYYRTVCSTSRGPRGPVRQCYQQPYYTQQAYSCMETVSIPYEVKDFDVDARVIVDVTNLTGIATSGEKISVTLYGDTVSISTEGSKTFFLLLKKQDIRGVMNGSVKFIDGIYAIELMEAAPILKALQLNNLSYSKKPVLSFDLGPIKSASNIGVSLDVTQKRTFASNRNLINRELLNTEYAVNATETGSAVEVNLEKLGINFKGRKFSIKATAFFKAPGTVLNNAQFGDALAVSESLKYKNR